MSSSARNITAWVLQGLLGLAFIASGAKKLLDVNGTIGMFSSLGLPGILAYLNSQGRVVW